MKNPVACVRRSLFCLSLLVAAGSCLCDAAERVSPQKKPPEFSEERFVRAFRASRENVPLRALAEAEQFHLRHPALPAALWQAIQFDIQQKRFGEPLFRAIKLHGSLDGPQILEQQTSLLSAADSRVVMLALDSLGPRKPTCPMQSLTNLAERAEYRNNYGFRHAVVSAVAQVEGRAGVDFLVATLAKSDGQLKYEVAQRLMQLSGQNFGGKTADWQTWWSANRDNFQFASAETAATKSAKPKGPTPNLKLSASMQILPWEQNVPVFLGMPVYAKRVVFVIDQSLSMLSSVDDVTRMRAAQRDFEDVVRMLPEDTWFNVISYESIVNRWQQKLVQATPLAKADAMRFVNGLIPNAKTSTYEALLAALDPQDSIEAILFLSDGEPTAGKIVDRGTIVSEITRINMFRRTSINAIGIDADQPSDQFLRLLSQSNFGTYRPLR